jgi:predicted RNase H-like HicB family nuclease
MVYRVELIKTEEGHSVGCPELPGCWSEGQTEEEALDNIKDAIANYVSVVNELSIKKEIRYVEVSDLDVQAPSL